MRVIVAVLAPVSREISAADYQLVLFDVAQFVERAEVAEKALGLGRILKAEDGVEERFGIGSPPVVGHGRRTYLACICGRGIVVAC